jgi:hypothetical protein
LTQTRQFNGQNEKNKNVNNDLQNNKAKYRATPTPQKQEFHNLIDIPYIGT